MKTSACGAAVVFVCLGLAGCAPEETTEDKEVGKSTDALSSSFPVCMVAPFNVPGPQFNVLSFQDCLTLAQNIANDYCARGYAYVEGYVIYSNSVWWPHEFKSQGFPRRDCRPAAPQAPQPPQIPVSGRVALFADINFGGGMVDFGLDGGFPYLGADWNDRVSSIRIPAGKTIILYEHANYGGRSVRLTSDVADLRAIGWNDIASSAYLY
jgi:hypothetical protein